MVAGLGRAANDSYVTTSSIYGYNIWAAPHGGGTITLAGTVKGGSATSVPLNDLVGLKSGQKLDVYVEMIGMPLIQNLMSAPYEWTYP
jgi:hypothetical protein